MTRVSYLVVVTSVLVAVTCPVHVLGDDGSGVTETLQCVTYNGQVINNTEDNPIMVDRDELGCTVCFCVDEDYYNDDDNSGDDSGDDSGRLPEALCEAGDCATARCVDAAFGDDQCCRTCPNGENCYFGTKKNRRIIKMGEVVQKGAKDCQCDDRELDFAERYNKQAVCRHSAKKSKRRRRRS